MFVRSFGLSFSSSPVEDSCSLPCVLKLSSLSSSSALEWVSERLTDAQAALDCVEGFRE